MNGSGIKGGCVRGVTQRLRASRAGRRLGRLGGWMDGWMWHGGARGQAGTALFGREKATRGALCVSRSHARLETRPRAQTVNARVRKRGESGGWDGWERAGRGGELTDRQTDLQDRVRAGYRGLCSTLTCSVGDQTLQWELLPAGSCAGSVATARQPLAVLTAGAQQAASSRQLQAVKSH